MKKVLALLMCLLFVPVVLAQEDFAKPTDKVSYAFQGVSESVEGLFQFGDEAKANFNLRLAERRMAEYSWAVSNNQSDLAGKIINRYQERLNKTLEHSARVGNESKRAEVQARIQEATQNHIEVLQRVRAKVPEQAYAGIDRALNNTQKAKEEVKQEGRNENSNR